MMIRLIFVGLLVSCNLLWAEEAQTVEGKEAPKAEEKTQEVKQSRDAKGDRSGFVIGVFGGASLMGLSSDYFKGIFEIEGMEKNFLTPAPSYGLKLGYDVYFLPSHGMRIYLDYMGSNFLDSSLPSGKIDIHTFALNAEYKFEINAWLGVFAGLNFNYSLLQSQNAGHQGALGVGANAGLTFGLASWAEVELGVRYLGDWFEDQQINPVDAYGLAGGATRQNLNFDNLFAFRMGLNFKF